MERNVKEEETGTKSAGVNLVGEKRRNIIMWVHITGNEKANNGSIILGKDAQKYNIMTSAFVSCISYRCTD